MQTKTTTVRMMLSAVGVSAALLACNVSKSVGEEDTTSGGELPVTMSGEASSAAPGGPGSATSGSPGSATSTSAGPGTASAGVTTAATGASCDIDLSPSGGAYFWECMCSSCALTYDEISFETMQLIEQENLCGCLCATNGCGSVEGEGGVSGGSPTATDTVGPTTATSGADTFSSGSTTGEGSASFTYEGCLDEGGVIVGDPGDGSVFEPGYLCPSGEPPLGWLEFEPGMAFPRNGGVCCPPAG